MPFADFVGIVLAAELRRLRPDRDGLHRRTDRRVARRRDGDVAVRSAVVVPSIDASVSRSTSLRARAFVIVTNGVVGTVIMFVAERRQRRVVARVDRRGRRRRCRRGSRSSTVAVVSPVTLFVASFAVAVYVVPVLLETVSFFAFTRAVVDLRDRVVLRARCSTRRRRSRSRPRSRSAPPLSAWTRAAAGGRDRVEAARRRGR